MKPILFEIGFIPLRAYGLFAALGFLGILWISSLLAKEKGIAKEQIFDILFILVVSAIIGSRSLYVIINYRSFLDKPLDVFKIWNGGIVFYGGLIAVITTLLFYFKKHNLPALRVFDILAVALPLGHASGRIGCFMAGCCHGKPIVDKLGNMLLTTDKAPWYAVHFPHDVGSFAPTQTFLHATQLYATTYNLAIFLFLFFIGRRIAKKDGDLFWWYLAIYPIFRSINEIFRGDIERKFFIQDILSLSQGISIPIVLLSLYMIFFHKRQDAIASQITAS